MTAAEAKNDRRARLIAVRSVLFLPASNTRAIARAREAGSDLVVLDLEDAVKSEAKHEARRQALDAAASDWPMLVAIRINGVGTEWHSLDVDSAAKSNADFVVVPRAASAHLVADLGKAVAKPVLAMIETAAGVLSCAEIAKSCAGLIAGTNDLRADLRLPLSAGRQPISAALQLIVLAARAAGVPVFDGVFNNLEDRQGFIHEAQEGRQLGFDGKSLIHPAQVEPCHRSFEPASTEIERAQALIDAFQGGAERFGEEMIERMHIEAAQRVVERARR